MVSSGNQPELYIKEEIVDSVQTFICSGCGFITNRKSSVAHYQATLHTPKLDLKCEVCRVFLKIKMPLFLPKKVLNLLALAIFKVLKIILIMHMNKIAD